MPAHGRRDRRFHQWGRPARRNAAETDPRFFRRESRHRSRLRRGGLDRRARRNDAAHTRAASSRSTMRSTSTASGGAGGSGCSPRFSSGARCGKRSAVSTPPILSPSITTSGCAAFAAVPASRICPATSHAVPAASPAEIVRRSRRAADEIREIVRHRLDTGDRRSSPATLDDRSASFLRPLPGDRPTSRGLTPPNCSAIRVAARSPARDRLRAACARLLPALQMRA